MDAPPNRNSEWRVHAIKLQMSFRRSFDQQRLYLFRGGVLHMRKNMRINVECERASCTAERRLRCVRFFFPLQVDRVSVQVLGLVTDALIDDRPEVCRFPSYSSQDTQQVSLEPVGVVVKKTGHTGDKRGQGAVWEAARRGAPTWLARCARACGADIGSSPG